MTLLTLLAACAPGTPPEAVSYGLRVAPSAVVPSVLVASWAAPPGEVGALELQRDGAPVATIPGRRSGALGQAALIGLEPGAAYRAVVRVGDREGPQAELVAPEPPAEIVPLWVAPGSVDGSALAGGHLLLAAVSDRASHVGVVDGDGRWRWWLPADPDRTFASARPTRDGRGILFLELDRARESDDARAVRVSWDGATRTEVSIPGAHHMVAELDQDELAWLTWDIRDVPWDQGEVSPVLADRLMVGRGDGDERELLSFFDDRGPPYVPCEHGLLPDQRLGVDLFEWTHGNSVVWDEPSDTITVIARLLDAIVRVDRRTGEVLWQAGGRDATLAWDDAGSAFSHGHASDLWADGGLVYDNGSHRDPPSSRVIEYTFDPDTGNATAVWTREDRFGRFNPYLGDVRRLPTGGVLVCDSALGTLQEIERDGTVSWWATTAPGEVPGRVEFLADWPPGGE